MLKAMCRRGIGLHDFHATWVESHVPSGMRAFWRGSELLYLVATATAADPKAPAAGNSGAGLRFFGAVRWRMEVPTAAQTSAPPA